MIRAVVFDLFGTLVPPWSATAGLEYQRAMARRLGADDERFGLAWHADSHGRMLGPLADSVRRVAAALGVAAPPDHEIAEFTAGRTALVAAALLEPRPEAVPTLVNLRARGLRIGLVSDSSSEVCVAWPSSPLARYVDVALFSAAEGVRKPDPVIFTRACERLGVSAAECVYVGDGGSDELSGAAAVGMRAVQLRSPDVRPVSWDGEAIDSLATVDDLVAREILRIQP